jgi:hypothetical protein
VWDRRVNRQQVKCGIEICEREVGEEQLDELVDDFDVEEDLAAYGVVVRQIWQKWTRV